MGRFSGMEISSSQGLKSPKDRVLLTLHVYFLEICICKIKTINEHNQEMQWGNQSSGKLDVFDRLYINVS